MNFFLDIKTANHRSGCNSPYLFKKDDQASVAATKIILPYNWTPPAYNHNAPAYNHNAPAYNQA